MARTKQKDRKRKRGEATASQGDVMEIIDLTNGDGKESLNRKQKMRKLFREQQKVIRQLEKKCQNPPSSETAPLTSEGSTNLETPSLSLPLNQRGAEERRALIDAATKEALMTRLLHLFPANKDKVCHTVPFISKNDHHRQIGRVKKQLGKMPFQSLKDDVLWLSSEGAGSGSGSGSRSRSIEGMTLAEELVKFADYVALTDAERSSRQRLLKELSDVVLSKFPTASVNAFGSYSADLSIFLSDLDISIHLPQSPPPFPPPSLPLSLPISHSSSLTNSAEPVVPAPPNQHIYLDNSESEEATAAAAKTSTKTEDDDVISWTIDKLQGGKNVLTSPTGQIESNKDTADVLCFDESDFIRQEEVSLPYDVDTSSSSEEEEEHSVAAGALTIDDYDDDDDSSKDDDDEEEEEVEDEGDAGDNREGESDVEVEEDLDIQVIGLPSQISHPEERRSLHTSEMEFSNAFQFDSDDGEYVSAVVSEERAEKQKAAKERDVIVGKLRLLMPVLKAMDWSAKIEFRSRAKVPIINLFHLNGVECDVSIGQAAKDTSELVAALKRKTGPALFVLSAFLKVFLAQLDLDKPFTGGLGSFKLYLMLARHVSDFYPNYQQPATTPSEHTSALVYGEMLLSFLQFYGNPINLNEHTDVSFDGSSVSFSNTRLAKELQTSFRRAHDILIVASQQRLALLKQKWRQRQQEQRSWEDDDASNEYSLSLLGTVIDAARLRQERSQHQRQCEMFPLRSEQLVDALVSQQLLPHLLDRVDLDPAALTLEQIVAVNPLLALRLRSFDSLDRLSQALSSERLKQQRQRRTQQVTSAASSSALTSTYSFNHYGVVGQSVAQAMMSKEGGALSQSKRKMKQRKKRRGAQSLSLYDDGGSNDYWEEEDEVDERRRKVRRYDSQRGHGGNAVSLTANGTVSANNDMSDRISQLKHTINAYKEKLHVLNS